MPPAKPAYDDDWIFSNNSDVHLANHRDWFVSYQPFITTVDSGFKNAGGQVLGIGDVELPTKTHPTRTGTAYQGTILLRDVLYAPSAFCNILGGPILAEHRGLMDFTDGTSKITVATTGACVGLLDHSTLFRLRLRGQSAKQSSLDPKGIYFIRANWPPSERARWEAFRANKPQGRAAAPTKPNKDTQPLTEAERKWLKENYGNEFHFLRSHGLSIYRDDDREEGRRILRALVDDQGDSDDDSLDSFQRDLENDPSSHFADYHFSEAELDWIKIHYGHSANFLRCYGLKFYDDTDCEEGKSIIQASMNET
ncbi:MAG: hypothetical protein Q9219_004979 [cf. Caloplaca sp. 3 TL-2023]